MLDKCIKSGFDRKLVKDMISITRQWKDRFSPPVVSTTKPEQRLVWATQFPKLLKLSQKEKDLNPKAMITYKRPMTLAGYLTNYRTIAHNTPSETGSKGTAQTRLRRVCANSPQPILQTRLGT